jgi:hypothetical protein
MYYLCVLVELSEKGRGGVVVVVVGGGSMVDEK